LKEEQLAMRGRLTRRIVWAACFFLLGYLVAPSVSHAATAQAIDAGADKALDQFRGQVAGTDEFLRNAKGYLVFPEVIQAGIGVGGQYGEGMLRIGGRSAAHYSVGADGSVVLLNLGAQASISISRSSGSCSASRVLCTT
jgi:hypothetical protein